MSTIDSKELIDEIIANNGWDEPLQATKIVSYTNFEGRTTYGVVYECDDQFRYEQPTDFVRNPRVIWEWDRQRHEYSH